MFSGRKSRRPNQARTGTWRESDVIPDHRVRTFPRRAHVCQKGGRPTSKTPHTGRKEFLQGGNPPWWQTRPRLCHCELGEWRPPMGRTWWWRTRTRSNQRYVIKTSQRVIWWLWRHIVSVQTQLFDVTLLQGISNKFLSRSFYFKNWSTISKTYWKKKVKHWKKLDQNTKRAKRSEKIGQRRKGDIYSVIGYKFLEL